MVASRILLWYRNDLRLHDHEPLHLAWFQKAEIIPLYCFDPRQFNKTSYGFLKTGKFRAKFLLESVADLRQQWRSLLRNSSHHAGLNDLIVRRGYPEEVIPQLAEALNISAVYYHSEVTSEELKVEIALKAKLELISVELVAFWGHTLYHPDDLPFTIAKLPELFTNFRKQVEKSVAIAPDLPAPTSINPASVPNIEVGELPQLADFSLESPECDRRSLIEFCGGETAGRERLHQYFWQQDRLRSYKDTRNGMLGADYSSKFSAWLALGCLSPRYVYAQVKAYEQQRVANDSTYWLVFELLWRDYFRFIAAKHGDRLFHKPGLKGLEIDWQENWEIFALWQQGQTGFPLVDANMRELAATGFMSNRGRQNVASFLTKNLGINWQLGAEWFESMLIDYDVCSNWGNWNYTAGVGNDARGFRYFNIIKQSHDYDPQGIYIKHWLPELAALPVPKLYEPWKLLAVEQSRFGVRLGVDYPRPIVDLFKSAQANEKIYNAALHVI
jgi:deoxyribodipyrimidine photo-lyase